MVDWLRSIIRAMASNLAQLDRDAFFDVEFLVRHGDTVPDWLGVALSFCRRPQLGVTANVKLTPWGCGQKLGLVRILNGRFDTKEGHAQGQRLLEADRTIDGVFAVNDFLAIGLIGVIREAHLNLGTDIAVVGYNDTPLAAELPVPLSSVRLPLHEMGEMAFQTLLARINGAQVESIHVQPKLMIRESSALFAKTA